MNEATVHCTPQTPPPAEYPISNSFVKFKPALVVPRIMLSFD